MKKISHDVCLKSKRAPYLDSTFGDGGVRTFARAGPVTPTNAVYVDSSLGFVTVSGLAGQLVSVGTQE